MWSSPCMVLVAVDSSPPCCSAAAIDSWPPTPQPTCDERYPLTVCWTTSNKSPKSCADFTLQIPSTYRDSVECSWNSHRACGEPARCGGTGKVRIPHHTPSPSFPHWRSLHVHGVTIRHGASRWSIQPEPDLV
jgi:hypothetical protein